jgi:putative transposase
MDENESLSHTKWECKCHMVFIPKCRRTNLYSRSCASIGRAFHRLAEQKESLIEEGQLMGDHVQ